MKTKITELFGIEHPVLSGGMAFVSLPPLVAAVSEAGGLGSLACGIAPPDGLREMIRATKSMTDRPFAVNFIVQFISDEHIDVVLEENVRFVEFFWANPVDTYVTRLQAAGVKVLMKVNGIRRAREAAEAGVDAIITQSATAGGHNKAHVGTFVLVPAVVDAVAPTPVIAAGGVADGRGLAAALALGADGVVVGTRLLATPESSAHDKYKQRILAATDSDIVRTSLFGPEWPSQPMNVIRTRIVEEWEGRDRQTPPPPDPPVTIGTTRMGAQEYEMPKFSAILPTAETQGDFEEMCLTAGQVSPMVNDIRPAGEIVRGIVAEAEKLLAGRLRSLG